MYFHTRGCCSSMLSCGGQGKAPDNSPGLSVHGLYDFFRRPFGFAAPVAAHHQQLAVFV
jgi:hypothetical protein